MFCAELIPEIVESFVMRPVDDMAEPFRGLLAFNCDAALGEGAVGVLMQHRIHHLLQRYELPLIVWVS